MNTWTLKLIYHAIFDSHLNYVNTVCGQNKNSPNRLFLLQKKALRLESLSLNVEMLIQTLFSVG